MQDQQILQDKLSQIRATCESVEKFIRQANESGFHIEQINAFENSRGAKIINYADEFNLLENQAAKDNFLKDKSSETNFVVRKYKLSETINQLISASNSNTVDALRKIDESFSKYMEKHDKFKLLSSKQLSTVEEKYIMAHSAELAALDDNSRQKEVTKLKKDVLNLFFYSEDPIAGYFAKMKYDDSFNLKKFYVTLKTISQVNNNELINADQNDALVEEIAQGLHSAYDNKDTKFDLIKFVEKLLTWLFSTDGSHSKADSVYGAESNEQLFMGSNNESNDSDPHNL